MPSLRAQRFIIIRHEARRGEWSGERDAMKYTRFSLNINGDLLLLFNCDLGDDGSRLLIIMRQSSDRYLPGSFFFFVSHFFNHG